MRKYVVLDKRVGQTPLEAITEWKMAHPGYEGVAASYAGRLDPMAHGLLLVLLGDECKRKEQYLGLDKEYEIEVLLDVGSDTGDVLGIVTGEAAQTKPGEASLRPTLRAEIGTHLRPYPSFSSKTVGGVPLFLHSLQGTLDTIAIPEHPETIYGITLMSVTSLPTTQLRQQVEAMLALAPHSDEPSKILGADFRIKDVRASWSAAFAAPAREFTVLRLRVTCGSGAYMRSLAARIGTVHGTRALALSIRRTRLGTYKKIGPFGFWARQYRLTTY